MTSNSFIWVLWLLLTNVSFSLSVPGPKGRDSPALQGPKVTVNGATYIGNTDANYGVDTWLGIRYAKPPTGSLRLQPPEKADNTGTVNAKNFGAQCFQLDPALGATLSEDCLTLNIYRPSQAAMERIHKDYHSAYLPVMFWIHGGGFNDDSGEFYNPESLVNTSIELETPTIVATINYRLNFFGFSGRISAF
jgi:carboxylesterase type B